METKVVAIDPAICGCAPLVSGTLRTNERTGPVWREPHQAKYLNVECKDGALREGVAGHLVFAIIADVDPAKKLWRDAVNPR